MVIMGVFLILVGLGVVNKLGAYSNYTIIIFQLLYFKMTSIIQNLNCIYC